MVDTSQSCPTNFSSKVELELPCVRFWEMVGALSGDGALALKVVADSLTLGSGRGAGDLAVALGLWLS